MPQETTSIGAFLARYHPFDLLPAEALLGLEASGTTISVAAGDAVYEIGDKVDCLFVILAGEVDLLSPEGQIISHFRQGESFAARTLFRGGIAAQKAVACGDMRALCIPKAEFDALLAAHPGFSTFFDRLRPAQERPPIASMDTVNALISSPLSDIMTTDPVMVSPSATAREAAAIMGEKHISCLLVGEGGMLQGILTTGDLTGRLLAKGLGGNRPVSEIMTPAPFSLGPKALVLDAMMEMSGRSIGHLPITEDGKAVGILTKTNLIRRQSVSALFMISDIGRLSKLDDLATVVGRLPQLLAQLVGSGIEAYKIGHLITSIADALTRRLLTLAEQELGAAPIPWLWLACGSQGRREQTGVSDQDNCLILHDDYREDAHGAYFRDMARFVSDGLNACGYVYCPGDMMATNDKWRQPARVWRGYYQGWIAKPDPMAQMLSSVMFDLRPIAGDESLYEGMHRETLETARANSIFRAHLIANSLKHTPPLGLFRGFALIRSGEHKDTLDLKHSGIVPIVDLARVYALDAAIEPVNTRERLFLARDAGSVSRSGADDLIDAYDLIANIRLEHQARQVRDGRKVDNFMAPSTLSALERNHLKDAFGVVKTMQSALSARGA
ncbi:cyclic nucleotide-binding/CBS domain-containing protein [Stappia sp. F7233]|uniref:Cyclic nucleotide-binding/CBS domain-containing protein n=1 Tax=Stappia albiluteola TaxID=2758565 RepID=A0A839AC20_9HYPH|nr:DUF294 nucleotidyltransferase-like domain-containing protein [Stappia albiluteola]MBA5777183.1 cyclic nucleotide-binding/CBS domain-containing protein [Stappia albiluteola]